MNKMVKKVVAYAMPVIMIAGLYVYGNGSAPYASAEGSLELSPYGTEGISETTAVPEASEAVTTEVPVTSEAVTTEVPVTTEVVTTDDISGGGGNSGSGSQGDTSYTDELSDGSGNSGSEANTDTSIPQTGDQTPIMLFFVMAIVSGCFVLVLGRKKLFRK